MPLNAAVEPALPLTTRRRDEVVFLRGRRAVTVGEFLAEVAGVAALLPEAGPALNICADRYLALVGLAAALARGHVTLLSADRSASRVQELAARHGAAYAVTDQPGPLPVRPVLLDGAALPAMPRAEAPSIPADRIAAIAFTSGSTGEPMPHAKSWGALVACAEAAAERFGLTGPETTSLVATVPPQHMYGFETSVVLPLHAAVASHAGPVFYPSDIAEALAGAPAPRILVTTPLQLRAQLDAPMPPLRAVISATAPLGAELADQAERRWNTRVLEIYGATEVGSIASRRTLDGEAWLPYRGIGLDIAEDRALVNVPGLPDPVPLADAVEWMGKGRFRLLGRRADLVKLAGKRASLAALNRILTAIEGVEDGVFLAPDDLAQNPAARLAALVVAPGRRAEDILAALRGRLDPAFLPRPLLLVPALPRNELGKLSRSALLALTQRSA